MPKIGDVFSGGTRIGEVWTGNGDGCLAAFCILIGIVCFPLLALLGIAWTLERYPITGISLVLFIVGSIISQFKPSRGVAIVATGAFLFALAIIIQLSTGDRDGPIVLGVVGFFALPCLLLTKWSE